MSAADILTRARAAGLEVTTDGAQLLVRPASRLTDDLRSALKSSKAELLALLKGRPRQSCTTCRHRSNYGTCREPVAAGLAPEFAICWPDPQHGATCPGWSRNPAEAVLAVLVAAAREGWTDMQMAAWLQDANQHPDATLDLLRNGGPTP